MDRRIAVLEKSIIYIRPVATVEVPMMDHRLD
ncbi:hypothetical protein AEAC466_20300 [Asticcacaulis sp. AC466]|nr:hypothetical protein AEAC466_20300 [Asticcacaulis sp. AC466]